MVSKPKSRILLLVLAFVGISANLIAVPWVIFAALFSPSGDRVWKIIVAYDQLANAATGGDQSETVSARAYKASLKGNRYGCLLCRFLDFLQPHHCENSVPLIK